MGGDFPASLTVRELNKGTKMKRNEHRIGVETTGEVRRKEEGRGKASNKTTF